MPASNLSRLMDINVNGIENFTFRGLIFDWHLPSSLILSVKNRGDGFLLSNNLFLKIAYILLQITVKEHEDNSNITVTKKVKITMKNIIFQNKSNIYD